MSSQLLVGSTAMPSCNQKQHQQYCFRSVFRVPGRCVNRRNVDAYKLRMNSMVALGCLKLNHCCDSGGCSLLSRYACHTTNPAIMQRAEEARRALCEQQCVEMHVFCSIRLQTQPRQNNSRCSSCCCYDMSTFHSSSFWARFLCYSFSRASNALRVIEAEHTAIQNHRQTPFKREHRPSSAY